MVGGSRGRNEEIETLKSGDATLGETYGLCVRLETTESAVKAGEDEIMLTNAIRFMDVVAPVQVFEPIKWCDGGNLRENALFLL